MPNNAENGTLEIGYNVKILTGKFLGNTAKVLPYRL